MQEGGGKLEPRHQEFLTQTIRRMCWRDKTTDVVEELLSAYVVGVSLVITGKEVWD